MNVHHLELFYYVARHEGLTSALRRIPYGLQHSALSGQLLQLERNLGKTLFHRRPFALTPEGRRLYEFVEPFFSNLESIGRQLQDGEESSLRLAASATVLRVHLQSILRNMQNRFPSLKLTLREANQPLAEEMLEKGEVDLAISMIRNRSFGPIKWQVLVELPLILLVRHDSPHYSAKEILCKTEDIPLINLPKHTTFAIFIERELEKKGIHWPTSIEVETLDLVYEYVSKGFGVGICVDEMPGLPIRGVRELPLTDFAKVKMGAFWRGKLPPVSQYLVELAKMWINRARVGKAK